MKTLKSLFVITLTVAALDVASVYATDALVSPHWKDAPQTVQGTDTADYAHSETALGNAAQSKANRVSAAAAGTKATPNRLVCKQIGKASCTVCGMDVARCTQAGMSCCK